MSKISSKVEKQQNTAKNNKTNSPKAIPQSTINISLLIVFLVPVLVYLQTISFGFVGFDDDMILVNNRDFFSHFSNIFHAFSIDALTTKQSLFYRPMQTISYLFDALISGVDKTWMYHFSNVLLIGLIAYTLFLLLKQFKISEKIAMFGSILYCVHPLFVSTVSWIPARGDLQLTLFSLLALVFFIEYNNSGKIKHLLLNILMYTLALFCKETAAMLPFLFALYILCFTDKRLFDKKNILHFFIFGIIGLQWFWMRSKAIVSIANQEDQVGFTSMYTMIKTIPESLAKFFIPFDIAPVPSFSIIKTSLGLLILIAIIVIFIKSAKHSSKNNLFFIGWFLLFIVPTLFFKHTLIDYLDHRFILPLVGIFIFALKAIPEKWNIQLEKNKVFIPITIVLCLGFNSFIKSKAYASQTTFYNEALAMNKNSCFIYYNRGCIKINNMDALAQVEEYSKAIALKSDYFLFYLNRGSAYSDANMNDKAIADYTKAIELKPNYADAFYNRGYVYSQMKFYDKAIADVSKAIEYNPTFYRAILHRASVYNVLNLPQKAIEDYTKAIEIKPNSYEPYSLRAFIYEQIKDYDNAINDYTNAINKDASKDNLYFNRANLYNAKGQPDKALEDYSKAIALNPLLGNALNNRGNTYYLKGMLDLACKDFEKADKLGVEAAKSNREKLCK